MASMQAEARKLSHLGLSAMPSRSTLADANKRRSEAMFESVYRNLYVTYRAVLSSDSRTGREPAWMKRLQIIDSTTITLFSNLIFRGVGRHPKSGKKKGGIKVHTIIHANEGVPSDIRFTSAATNDSFMLKPSALGKGDIMAMDRAYINLLMSDNIFPCCIYLINHLGQHPDSRILSCSLGSRQSCRISMNMPVAL